MALLDIVKKQLETPAARPSSSGLMRGGEQTSSVRDLLRAKSGKETTPGSAPRQSSIQEKMANRQTDVGLDQIGQKGQIQAEQIEQRETDIDQRESQQQQGFLQNIQNMNAQFQRETDSMLNQYESGQKSLDTKRDVRDLEQLGFMARMDNDKYINNLQSIGKKKRLDSGANFQKEMAKSIFRDQVSLTKDRNKFDAILSSDNREFQKELSEIDLDFALQIANDAISAAGTKAVAQGVGGVVSAAVKSKGLFQDNSGAPTISEGAMYTEGDE